MTEDRIAALEQRITALENPRPREQWSPPTEHHPRPGTWASGSLTAECRYCGRRITRTESGDWQIDGSSHCNAHASGTPARD